MVSNTKKSVNDSPANNNSWFLQGHGFLANDGLNLMSVVHQLAAPLQMRGETQIRFR